MRLPTFEVGANRLPGAIHERRVAAAAAAAARISVGRAGLGFSCNPLFCACSGDADCNDMFTTSLCGPRAICIDNVCYCGRW